MPFYSPVTVEEIAMIHDRLELTEAGLLGRTYNSKIEAVVERIAMLDYYGELSDLWLVAAAHLETVARGHVFADFNKRTALLTLTMFLLKNKMPMPKDQSAMVELTVKAATGEYSRADIAAELRRLTHDYPY